MSNIFIIIKEIIIWLLVLAAFSCIGFSTDNPSKGILLWALIFVAIFAIVFVITKNTHKRKEKATKGHKIIKKIFGIILILFACILPELILSKARFSFGIQTLIFALSVIWILIMMAGTYLVNLYLVKKKTIFFAFLGYLVLIINSVYPALVMIQYDNSYNALGTVYYLVIALAILSWSGLSFLKPEEIT